VKLEKKEEKGKLEILGYLSLFVWIPLGDQSLSCQFKVGVVFVFATSWVKVVVARCCCQVEVVIEGLSFARRKKELTWCGGIICLYQESWNISGSY